MIKTTLTIQDREKIIIIKESQIVKEKTILFCIFLGVKFTLYGFKFTKSGMIKVVEFI